MEEQHTPSTKLVQELTLAQWLVHKLKYTLKKKNVEAPTTREPLEKETTLCQIFPMQHQASYTQHSVIPGRLSGNVSGTED